MTNGRRLAILGAGVMGETLLSGLLRSGWTPDQIVATDRRPERHTELVARYGVAMAENEEAVADLEEQQRPIQSLDGEATADLVAEVLDSPEPFRTLVTESY